MSTIIRDCFLLFNVVIITAFSFILFYFCVPFCVVFILCLHCPWYGGSVSSRQQLIYILPVIKSIIPKAKKHISCSVSKLWKLISFLNLFFFNFYLWPLHMSLFMAVLGSDLVSDTILFSLHVQQLQTNSL